MATLSKRLSADLGLAAFLAVMVAQGCGRSAPPSGEQARLPPSEGPASAVSAPMRRIVFLGDSLTAGYGLSPVDAFPSLIQRRAREAGLAAEVVNAGVSGDTSAGGLRRLDWALDGDVRVLVVALGGNDALRGLSVDELRSNLASIVEKAQARHVTVVLAGMEAPPNLGAAYTSAFRKVYRDLAARYHVALIPFLLDGVAGVPDLNQADGIHPNTAGARKVAEIVWPFVERAIRRAGSDD